MWELLKAEAREDGELEERTVNRKDGPVVVATPYGVRYRQLGLLTGITRIQNVELLDLFVQLHTAGEQLGKYQNILKHG